MTLHLLGSSSIPSLMGDVKFIPYLAVSLLIDNKIWVIVSYVKGIMGSELFDRERDDTVWVDWGIWH